MRLPNLIAFILIVSTSFGQEYAANLIPDSLKQNANAVLRFEELNVKIKDIDKAIVKHKYVITVLNETGDKYATYFNHYDKLISLSDISANLFDANGIKIKSAKRKEIYDVSDDGDAFLTDNRVKAFSFHHKAYPYTIEFEDEQTYDGIYYLPSWSPVRDDKFAVQQSNLLVETPIDYGLRYKQLNISKEPIISNEKKIKYSWNLQNYKAVEEEVFMPKWSDVTPTVFIAPTKFSIEGYKGEMQDWKGFGNFSLNLNQKRSELPDVIKQKVHQLTDNLNSAEEKINILYDYLQKNTRYISIQLGIGGWQPLPASFVAEKKYGDCKALSNFMVSLLKEANIASFFTIINSGEFETQGLDINFPMVKFNHIVTCVPMNKDTLWLECTSQTASPGYMGTFTGNRKAIAITDSGGVVVSTPKFIANQNKEIRKINATIDDKGNLNLASNCILSGIKQEFAHSLLHDATEEQRIRYLNKYLKLPTYTVNNYNFKETKGRVPTIVETLDITAPSYASISGKRMFVVPNLLSKQSKLDSDKTRLFDIVYRTAFIDIDSIEIKIPLGYNIEMIPKNVDITNKFGKYKINYTFLNGIIKVYRYYEQSTDKFPASDYKELLKFYDEMYKADRAKMVLVKQE